MRRSAQAVIMSGLLLVGGGAGAAVIQVTPADNWTKIESAKAGDIVELAPGTYKFRVMLEQQGTASSPITIRAKDPANRPVWDLGGKAVGAWPGSYTAADKGRGCWQVQGSHYVISGIVFKNCQDDSSAGLRAVDCGPVTVRDCLFAGNTNGITGSSENLVVEFSEFVQNGKLTSTGSMTHNVYIYGGVFALRYSYVHDSHEGQNFHVRARDSVIEYNWIARPDAYVGDLMSCNTICGGTGQDPITQKMLLRGNVIIQGTPKNTSQVIALYNDEPDSYDDTGSASTLELTMIGNTVIGSQTDAGDGLVNLRNDTAATKLHLSNNIFVKIGTIHLTEDPGTNNWSVDGQNNWAATGVEGTSKLTGTITGADPGFVNAAGLDFTLSATSPCAGKAAAISGLPDKEYYRNETVKLQYRPRATAKDVGAFERGNSAAPVGPYGAPPKADLGLPRSDASSGDSVREAGPGQDAGGPGRRPEGCECGLAGRSVDASPIILVALLGLLLAGRRGTHRGRPRL